MPIFKVIADKLKTLNALPLDKEKNLQRLLEENLVEVLELRFLASEYVTTNRGRIDTLSNPLLSGEPYLGFLPYRQTDSIRRKAIRGVKQAGGEVLEGNANVDGRTFLLPGQQCGCLIGRRLPDPDTVLIRVW